MIRIRPGTNHDSGLMDRITDFASQAEARGFPGVWVGDSLGRGRRTLDSLQVLTALAAVTRPVDLGVAVPQLPLRNPIELAHIRGRVCIVTGTRRPRSRARKNRAAF